MSFIRSVKSCKGELLLEQLEERIVLDGAVEQATNAAESAIDAPAVISDDAAQPAMWVWRTFCWVWDNGDQDWYYIDDVWHFNNETTDEWWDYSTGAPESEVQPFVDGEITSEWWWWTDSWVYHNLSSNDWWHYESGGGAEHLSTAPWEGENHTPQPIDGASPLSVNRLQWYLVSDLMAQLFTDADGDDLGMIVGATDGGHWYYDLDADHGSYSEFVIGYNWEDAVVVGPDDYVMYNCSVTERHLYFSAWDGTDGLVPGSTVDGTTYDSDGVSMETAQLLSP